MKKDNTGIYKLNCNHYIELQDGKCIAVVCEGSPYSRGRIFRNEEGFEPTLTKLLSDFVYSKNGQLLKEVRNAIAEDELASRIMEEVS